MNILGKFPRKFLDAPKALIKELVDWPLLPKGSPSNDRHPINKGYFESTIAANFKGRISGLVLSNNPGTPNTLLDISAGWSFDSTGTALLSSGAFTKDFGSVWAVGTGNGGMDTGTLPTSGTLHIFQIQRTDTGVVDFLGSTSLTPTMPANYTLSNRVGSILTDASAHIIGFVQNGDKFEFKTPPALDVDVINQSTSSVTRLLSVPTGIKVEAIFTAFLSTANGTVGVYFRNLDLADVAASNTASPLCQVVTANGTTQTGGGPLRIYTNTSGQIGTRATAASTTLKIATLGWIDHLGRTA